MGSEAEAEDSSTPRLPLFLKPPYVQSPQRSGMLTPPLYSSAAVPFRWEEEPGKPRECSGAITTPTDLSPKCLELPPRLLLEANVSKLPSPTTVLDGPYTGRSSRFQSSSFRMIRRECYGSFRTCSPERDQFTALVLSKRGIKDRGFLGSWRWGRRGFKGKREVAGASYVFPSSSMDREVEDGNEEEKEISSKNVTITRIRRSGSFSTSSRSHFWATIYEGLKQVVPWRSRKLKKDGFFI
ncbi:uncharacterized protein At4g00950 [Ricinus communis]|uniref:uncharacterized protein At4g00950 n=1 Tax=Ricinus communis TaxID=3988 RepID=UPI00201AF225|nr:uncharacterized protein At4g00950 [Ricinus communis]